MSPRMFLVTDGTRETFRPTLPMARRIARLWARRMPLVEIFEIRDDGQYLLGTMTADGWSRV